MVKIYYFQYKVNISAFIVNRISLGFELVCTKGYTFDEHD